MKLPKTVFVRWEMNHGEIPYLLADMELSGLMERPGITMVGTYRLRTTDSVRTRVEVIKKRRRRS